MPRAKKVDSVKKDEDLVTVEMTEKEKKEFAKFMADKEDKGEEKEPEPMAYGELRFAHFINGDPYGPGKFQAPRDVAMNLIAADEKYLRRKMKEKESDEFMIDIQARGPGRITRIEKEGSSV